MKKIIKKGNTKIHFKCKFCKCKFIADQDDYDIIEETSRIYNDGYTIASYIKTKCPWCGKEVYIG